MEPLNYFWDSYAVIELIKGNSNYKKYSEYPIKITIFNIVEIYWFAIHEYGEKSANNIFDKLKNSIMKVNDEIVKDAIKFRKKVYKNKKISYADALGYTYALKNNLKFLTGDKEFEDLRNVEFVK